MTRPSFTIGIEEEYQTIDPVTRDLRSHIHSEIIAKGKLRMEERIKAEMHQSVVEVGTGVCKNIKEAKAEVIELRREMIALARENGLLLAAGATHPFADWRTQEIYPDERYHRVVEDFDSSASTAIPSLLISVGMLERQLDWIGRRYRFTHALMHEAVYRNLLLSRRIELHERAGRALEYAAGAHPERIGKRFGADRDIGPIWSLSMSIRQADHAVEAPRPLLVSFGNISLAELPVQLC